MIKSEQIKKDEILEVRWLSNIKGNIGFIKVRDAVTGKVKMYIGIAGNQNSEETSINNIKAWGNKLEKDGLKAFSKFFKIEE